jgi:acyl-CoA thioesterase
MNPAAIVSKMLENDAFSRWLGIEVVHCEAGACTLSMQIRSEMLNGFGIAHGGITYALADSALAFASNAHGRKALSIETSINHTETLKDGDKIIAVATELSLKNSIAIYQVTITSKDKQVALFKGIVYRTEKEWV